MSNHNNQDKAECEHLQKANQKVSGNTTTGCEECEKIGDEWVHLRLCLSCGHVGCCDGSKNKHATKHFHKTNHPVIKSYESSENWKWCFIDQVIAE